MSSSSSSSNSETASSPLDSAASTFLDTSIEAICDHVEGLCKTKPQALTSYYAELAKVLNASHAPPGRFNSICSTIHMRLCTLLPFYTNEHETYKVEMRKYTDILKKCKASKTETLYLTALETIHGLLGHLDPKCPGASTFFHSVKYDKTTDTIDGVVRDDKSYPLDVKRLEARLGKVLNLVRSDPNSYPNILALLESSKTMMALPFVSLKVIAQLKQHIQDAPWKQHLISVAPPLPPPTTTTSTLFTSASVASPTNSRKRAHEGLFFSTDAIPEVHSQQQAKRARLEDTTDIIAPMDEEDDDSSIKDVFTLPQEPLLAPPPAAITAHPDPIIASKLPTLDHLPLSAPSSQTTAAVAPAPEQEHIPWYVRWPNGFKIRHGHMVVHFKRVVAGPNVQPEMLEHSKNVLCQLAERIQANEEADESAVQPKLPNTNAKAVVDPV